MDEPNLAILGQCAVRGRAVDSDEDRHGLFVNPDLQVTVCAPTVVAQAQLSVPAALQFALALIQYANAQLDAINAPVAGNA